ncbi:MAG: hypothetical protein VW418_04840 [Gammaproteobacteria bacterium]
MYKINEPSIDKQRELVETKLNQLIKLSANSSFDVSTVIEAFLSISIDLAYRMSSHHQLVEELIADKVIDAKMEYPEETDQSRQLH